MARGLDGKSEYLYLPPLTEIGERLRSCRGDRTANALSKLIRADGPGITKSEEGKQLPKFDLLAFFALEEGISTDAILYGGEFHPKEAPTRLDAARRACMALTPEQRRLLMRELLLADG